MTTLTAVRRLKKTTEEQRNTDRPSEERHENVDFCREAWEAWWQEKRRRQVRLSYPIV